ncbi:MAG: HDOD domain-containing protein [Fibrobacterales bacterium]
MNEQEVQVFETVFSQRNIEVKIFKSNSGSYLELMKYKPDAILMEFPEKENEQLHLIKLIRGNKKLSKAGLICYGNHSFNEKEQQYRSIGVKYYFTRPLKISYFFNSLIQSVGPDLEKLISNESEESEDEKSKELDLLLKPDVPGSQKIDIMVKHVGKLMAFPYSIAKIVQLTASDKSSANELAQVIRSDASIATSIIKLSNSVVFSSLNREINDVKDAIVRIGFDETKKVTLGLAVMQLLDQQEKNFGFNRHEFWYHSLATALISEKLAKAINYPNPSLAFLCGLLHDYAALLYDEFFGVVFEVIMENTYSRRCTFDEAGHNVLNINQNEFMLHLFKKWNMPKDLLVALRGLQKFPSEVNGATEEQNKLIKAVGFADILAKSARIGRSCDEILHPIPDAILKDIKLNIGIKDIYFDSIFTQVNLFVDYLGLDRKTLPVQMFKPSIKEKTLKMAVVEKKRSLFESHLFYLEHTGFAQKKHDNIEDLEADWDEISMVVYNLKEGEKFKGYENIYTALSTKSKPGLIFYYDQQGGLDHPKNPLIKSLSCKIDAQLINIAIKEIMCDDVEIAEIIEPNAK